MSPKPCPPAGFATRRAVDDETFRAAYEDPDNAAVIRSAANGYRKQLDEDDRESCGLQALWRALSGHDARFGQKFTTSLYRFVHWECRKLLRRRQSERPAGSLRLDEVGDVAAPAVRDAGEVSGDVLTIKENLGFLSSEQRAVLLQYYHEGYTIEEIGLVNRLSKETVRSRLDGAVLRLRELCGVDDRSPRHRAA